MIAKRHILAQALRVAAEQYDADARVHATPLGDGEYWSEAGRKRLVECFEQQALNARALADAIEQADTIKLED